MFVISIFDAVVKSITKLVCIAIDGAPNMKGKWTGFVRRVGTFFTQEELAAEKVIDIRTDLFIVKIYMHILLF